MRLKQLLSVRFLFFLCVYMTLGCKSETPTNSENPYIFANTSGLISKTGSIKVVFSKSMITSEQVGTTLKLNTFQIVPAVRGQATWEDDKTIIFKPENFFEPDKTYQVNVSIGKLHSNISKEHSFYSFNVRIVKPDFSLQKEGWETGSTNNYEYQFYRGTINTSDLEVPENVAKLLTGVIEGKSVPVAWTHSGNGLRHTFAIGPVKRTNTNPVLKLTQEGTAIGAKGKTITEELTVPALNDFEVHDLFFSNDDDFYFTLNFTDPVLPGQSLDGLITIDGYMDHLRTLVEGNNIKVYPETRISGFQTVNVSPSVKNTKGQALGKPWLKTVQFMDTKPAVRYVNRGNIMPDNNGLILPFEAINLNTVDIEIVQIYSNNIIQYYQIYDGYESQYDIARVGKIVLQKSLRLADINSAINKTSWVKYGLDLNKLIEADKNAIYQIRLGFRKAYSTYACISDEGNWAEASLSETPSGYDAQIESFYDYNYSGYALDYNDYNWQERNNPCSPLYYNKDNFAVQSVYKSSIGLLSKGNDQGNYFSVVTDLITGKPLSGAQLTFYDYQQQIIAKGISGEGGVLETDLPRKPFMLIADRNGEKSYLLLDDGRSLSMSKFDVGGFSTQKGLKGYLYAERGVWRPGDSIFMNFIMEDKLQTLPNKHPVHLELIDPKNVVVSRLVHQYERGKILALPLLTSEDAPTGVWKVKVNVGGATFNKLINIETVKPNRLKIDFKPNKTDLTSGVSAIRGTLDASWLIGTPAANMRATVDANMRPAPEPFSEYKDYTFFNQNIYGGLEQRVFDGKLNSVGHAPLEMKLNPNGELSQITNVVFKTTVFEDGGNFSIDYVIGRYSPLKAYVGVKVPHNRWGEPALESGKSFDLKVVQVNHLGKPMANVPLTVDIYRVDWRWWWEGDASETSYYTGSYNKDPIVKLEVKTGHDGTAAVPFQPKTWGRYFVRVSSEASNHKTGTFFYSGYPDDVSLDEMANLSTQLPLGLDQKEVKAGQPIKLSFQAPDNSMALITIENADQVVHHEWVSCVGGNNLVQIKTTDAMGSNCYAYVTLIQPHNQSGNDMPVRMYGVVPVKIINENLVLKPVIDLPNEIEPDKDVKLTISESSGKPMTYTVAIVDEGLLDLTKYKSPNPYTFFHAKEALSLKTWDLYDYVIGAYGGRLARIFAVGGDMALQQVEGAPKANRFKPAVVHLGPFHLTKGKKAHHTIRIINYMGSVRAMVVAVNNNAYGAAETTSKVVKPLMVSATMPRVLAPGESLNLPVNIFVTKPGIKSVQVKFSDKSGILVSESSAAASLQFSEVGEQMTYMPVKVSNREGTATLVIEAQSGNIVSKETIDIEVRNPNMPVVVARHIAIDGKSKGKLDGKVFGIPGTNGAVLELSTFLPVNLSKHLNTLIDYPYGCLEQTISRAFPQLFLDDFVTLSTSRKQEINTNVNAALQRIIHYQSGSGWFSYWPGNNLPDEYSTNYAVHFMLEAKRAGYQVQQSVLEGALSHQKKTARLWRKESYQAGLFAHNGDINQAYRLYVLALADAPELAAMNQLREMQDISVLSRWMLAAAYARSGKKNTAANMVAKLNQHVVPYAEFGYTFGSDLRDQAVILNTLTSLGDAANAHKVAKSMSEKMNGNNWYATHSLAFGLWSLASYLKAYPPSKGIKASYTLQGKKYNVSENGQMITIRLPERISNYDIQVENLQDGALYASLSVSGKPSLTNQVNQSENLDMTISYVDRQGHAIDVSKLKRGTEFVVAATIRNTSPYNFQLREIALTQIFPSGWEIINDRMEAGMNSVNQGNRLNYQDIRDDRVNSFFNLSPGASVTVRTKLIAAYAGNYFMPATQAIAMYNNTVKARVSGQNVMVE